MCLGSGGSQSRPSNMDSGKPAFMSCALRSAFLEPSGSVLQALTLSGRATFIVSRLRHRFLGECRRGSRHFWNNRVCVGYSPAPGTLNIMASYQTRAHVGHSKNISYRDNSVRDTHKQRYHSKRLIIEEL